MPNDLIGKKVKITSVSESIPNYLSNSIGTVSEVRDQELYAHNISVDFISEDPSTIYSYDFSLSEIEIVSDETRLTIINIDSSEIEDEDLHVDKGEISDGYHTFNELYEHRTKLFAIICNVFIDNAWKSLKHFDDSMYEGYFIVGVTTSEGDYSYHCDMKYWDIFNIPTLDHAPQWDGHKPEDIDRLFSLLD